MRVTPPDWLVKSTALLLKYIIDFLLRRRGYENRVIIHCKIWRSRLDGLQIWPLNWPMWESSPLQIALQVPRRG